MRYFPIGTAGHVDHGKTSLIKALTGIDTDRLPEEKKRGLSIDMGFAYIDFPDIDLRVEIIDVPGHERFIKNAIAGLCACEMLLLVVDIVEGIKAQTVDHVMVAKALGINLCLCAITKIDKAKELISRRVKEVEEFLIKEGFKFKVVPVSVRTGEGIDELKETLKSMIRGVDTSEKEDKPLRITLDSSFTVRGFGTVVRGSCIEGKLKRGETVVLEPLGERIRVRRMQNHGRFVEEVKAGERVAINVPKIEKDKVKRGFLILKENTYVKSKVLIVEFKRDVRLGKPYFFFFLMKEIQGTFKRITEDIYILKLKEEVISKRDDRVVVLNSSGNVEGGLKVLHPHPKILSKKFIKENSEVLKKDLFEYLLKEFYFRGINEELYFKLTGKKLIEHSKAVKLGSKLFHSEALNGLKGRVYEIIKYELPKKGKVSIKEIANNLKVDEELVKNTLKEFKNLVVEDGFIFSLETINVDELGEGVFSLKELKKRGISKAKLLIAVKEGRLHRIGEDLFITDGSLKRFIKELYELGEIFSIQEAKQKLNLSRRYLIPLLEYMDKLGYTERRGNVRVWKKKP